MDMFTCNNLIEKFKQNPEFLHSTRSKYEMYVNYIEDIFRSIIQKLNLMPYFVRCICKMIEILLKNRFPEINLLVMKSFVGHFLFEIYISPALENCDLNNVLLNEVISTTTKKKLMNIVKILSKFNRYEFFEKSDSFFNLFNHYLIDLTPSIVKMLEHITNFSLPTELKKIVEKNLNEYENIHYFKKHQQELYQFQSICFSVQDLAFIYDIMSRNLVYFVGDNLITKIVEKLNHQEKFLHNLMIENSKKFYLILLIEENPSMKTILNTNFKQQSFSFESDNESIVKRVKFCISTIFKSITSIDPNFFSYSDLNPSNDDFLILLNNIIKMEEYTMLTHNDRTPLSWYSLYLTSNIQSLPDEYKENNYQKLYQELLSDVEGELNFLRNKSNVLITRLGLNNRNIEKIIEKYTEDFSKVKNNEKLIKIEQYMKKSRVKVCIKKSVPPVEEKKKDFISKVGTFFFGEKTVPNKNKNKDFSETIIVCAVDECIHSRLMYLEGLSDKKISKKAKNHATSIDKSLECHVETIDSFIKKLSAFKEIKEDIHSGENKLKISDTLQNYMKIVKKHVKGHDIFKGVSESELQEVVEDINNYIDRELYKRVFPDLASAQDIRFFMMTTALNWITPNLLDIDPKYYNEGLWESAIRCIKKMDDEKSPFDKVKCLFGAYNIVVNCINFCSGKEMNAGIDDCLPIFIYIMIKACPTRIYSNFHFIQILIGGEKLISNFGLLVSLLELSIDFITKINHEKLKLTNDEFNQLMKKHHS